MTLDKCFEVLDRYERFLSSIWTLRKKDRETVDHLIEMIPQMRGMLCYYPRVEKFMRWLGFIQGVLWQRKWFTLEELKEHNREV
jgi:hypothetical protein